MKCKNPGNTTMTYKSKYHPQFNNNYYYKIKAFDCVLELGSRYSLCDRILCFNK